MTLFVSSFIHRNICPGGLQVGGGINDQNAQEWIGYGASKVRVCVHTKVSTARSHLP